MKLEGQFKNGANWFFWVAGLSLINSAVLLSNGQWAFIIGLGITQIIDVIAGQIGTTGKFIALGFDIVIAGVFVVFGVLARKNYNWAFIAGMILYCLDGLLFLLIGDILSIVFHAFVLFSIFKGLQAANKLKSITEQKL